LSGQGIEQTRFAGVPAAEDPDVDAFRFWGVLLMPLLSWSGFFTNRRASSRARSCSAPANPGAVARRGSKMASSSATVNWPEASAASLTGNSTPAGIFPEGGGSVVAQIRGEQGDVAVPRLQVGPASLRVRREQRDAARGEKTGCRGEQRERFQQVAGQYGQEGFSSSWPAVAARLTAWSLAMTWMATEASSSGMTGLTCRA
jgi:hypothetical protein